MRTTGFQLRVCAVLLALAACGDGSSGGEGDGDEGAAGQGAMSENACNAMPNTGSTIEELAVAEDIPGEEASGGTIMEGTYHMTSHTTYVSAGGMAGSLGHTRKQTLIITSTGAGTYEIQSILSNDGEPDDRVTLVATLPGPAAPNRMMLDIACPVQAFFTTMSFTATPTTLTTYDTEMSEVAVFTRVP